jgi:AraC family transcriptional regulator, regulatory protein of adaptative response / DNA-3-methyladenine glycosylase II
MELNHDSCYQALAAHDSRFDGAFYVGVATTGIYCRTVCTARTPRRENCTFYPSAAAAEKAGFRPCLLCRPELAPGNARVDAVGRLAAAVYSRIEDGALSEQRVEDLASTMGVSDRHLRRIVEREFGVSPVELAQTQRLLLAKRLLTDTDLPVTEVAFASGFSSLRRFNALFKERYHLNPTELRKRRAVETTPDVLVCELAYRPPFDWTNLITYLTGRGTRGVESRDRETFRRTVRIKKAVGWLSLRPSGTRNTLRVEISSSLAPALLPVLSRVKRLCDLAAEPQQIAALLGPLSQKHPGLRVPGAFDGFEIAVRAILGQQISVKAATTLAGRFAMAFGETIQTPFSDLTHLYPTPERIARAEPAEIIALGIIGARANSLIALAKAVAEGTVSLEPSGDVESAMARLRQLPGIGEWTAQYIAMRALAWPDAFPHTDLGIRKALGETDSPRILKIAASWQPYRAYAVMHLWKSLEAETTTTNGESE